MTFFEIVEDTRIFDLGDDYRIDIDEEEKEYVVYIYKVGSAAKIRVMSCNRDFVSNLEMMVAGVFCELNNNAAIDDGGDTLSDWKECFEKEIKRLKEER